LREFVLFVRLDLKNVEPEENTPIPSTAQEISTE